MNIEWIEAEIPFKKLKANPRNPRQIKDLPFEKLVQSLKEDGYHSRIKVNLDNVIIGGHQRKRALIAAGFNAQNTIKVLLPNRLLQETEIKRIMIRDNVHNGEYDMDILSADFEAEDLVNWGLAMGDWVNQIEDKAEEKPKDEKKKQKCPECGYES